MISMKLWIYKDRAVYKADGINWAVLARPWHVQGETGCTLGSFRTWRAACNYACLTVGTWRVDDKGWSV